MIRSIVAALLVATVAPRVRRRAAVDVHGRRRDGLLHHRQRVDGGRRLRRSRCRRDREGDEDSAGEGLRLHRAGHHRGTSPRCRRYGHPGQISAWRKGQWRRSGARRRYIPIFIDRRPLIAHNEVTIIDDGTVLTGSFNWTKSAECCNAENLLVLRRSDLALAYAENFARCRAVSVGYVKAQH
jgi:phosphatidylserine/phosphatidylglycerophosphate/cardiolipin synthase-like enzyme